MLVAKDTGKNYSVPFTSGITGVICPQVSLTLWQSLQELGVTYSRRRSSKGPYKLTEHTKVDRIR